MMLFAIIWIVGWTVAMATSVGHWDTKPVTWSAVVFLAFLLTVSFILGMLS